MGTPTRAEAWCGAKAGAMVPPALSHSQQNPGRNMTVKAKAALSFDNKKVQFYMLVDFRGSVVLSG